MSLLSGLLGRRRPAATGSPMMAAWEKYQAGRALSGRESAMLLDHFSQLQFAHYAGAETGRLNSDWSTAYDTPYWNLRGDRTNLIARCQRMVDNNPIAQALLETIITDVVHTGLKPTPRVKFSSGEPVTGINKALAEAWKRYNDQWDATGESSFYEAQGTILREVITTGGCLTNKVAGETGNLIKAQTQLVSVLRLDTSRDESAPTYSDDPATKQTVFGINIDERGRPRSYWIQGIDRPVSANYMHQVYRRRLAEQYTCPPWFAAALRWLWAQEQLIKDKLIASRIQAMIGLLWPSNTWAEMARTGLNSDSQVSLESGKIHRYDPKVGEPKILQADDSVKEVLEPLQRILLHAISVSLGWSYMTVTRDVSEINMAAGKINTSRDRQMARLIQRWFAKSCCQWEWEFFVSRCFIEGVIPGKTLSDYLADPWRYNECQWQGAGWDFVDPYREAQAVDVQRKGGLMTLQRWYADQGVDWKDAVDQLSDEQSYLRSKGIDIPGVTSQPTAQPAGAAGSSAVPVEDGEDDSQ